MKPHHPLYVAVNSAVFFILFGIQAFAFTTFTGTVPVKQNFTTESLALLTVFREPGQEFSYEISPPSASIRTISNDIGLNHTAETIQVTGLGVGTPFKLIIRNRQGKIIDSRNFKALNQNEADPKVAICSCSRIGLLSPDDKNTPMWDQVFAQKPNALIVPGDIVYGDNAWQAIMKHFFNRNPTLAQIQGRFIQSWKTERLYRQENLVPLFTIWDDHDFGYEAADENNPFKKEMTKLFRSYYPIPDDPTVAAPGPGTAFSFQLFGKKILMLDNRTFFNRKKKSLLGMSQVEWIENEVKGQQEVIIISGMSVIKMGKKSKQENLLDAAPTEWEAFRRIFENNPVRAVFLTGDVHYSEVRFIPKEVLGFETVQGVFSHLKSTSSYFTPPFWSGHQPNDENQRFHESGRNFAILSMKDMYTRFEAVFHRSKSIDHVIRGVKDLSPVKFVLEYKMNQCERFYKATAN